MELRDVRGLAVPGAAGLPPHLAGLPDCLHKYGPLFAEHLREEHAGADQASAA